jgi:hypothetical protein
MANNERHVRDPRFSTIVKVTRAQGRARRPARRHRMRDAAWSDMLGAKLDQGFILIGGVALAGHAVSLSGGRAILGTS